MSLMRRWMAGGWVGGLLLAGGAIALAGDRYVVKGNPGAAAPYESWATAAADIQTAVDVACEGEPVWVRSTARYPILTQRSFRSVGDTVWVRAGVYDVGGPSTVLVGGWPTRWRLTNRVAIAKAIVVRSEHNDPTTTIIKGAWAENGLTNGPGATRCAYVADGAMLIGFTLTGGATLTTNEVWSDSTDRSGGGVLAQSDKAVISNCIITGNAAFGDPRNSARGGGGACGGKFYNCVFTRNTTPFRGGGADHAVLSGCVLVGNVAGGGGGGAHGGVLRDCIVSNNMTSGSGGGVLGWSVADRCMLYDSVLVGNRAGRSGGGAEGPATLIRCNVLSNVASNDGGGAGDSILLNSWISGNRTLQRGGGLHACNASNVLVTYNVATMGGGVCGGRLANSLLYGNEAVDGGGIYGSELDRCTVVGNRASHVGGGVASFLSTPLSVNNTIIQFNQAADCANWAALSGGVIVFSNACTRPEQARWAAGNGTNDPQFVGVGAGYGTSHVAGDYRLSPGSPCRNSGFQWNGAAVPRGWRPDTGR